MNLTTWLPINEIFPDKDETLSLNIYEDGAAGTPSSPSFTLYDSAGNEKDSGTPGIVGNVLSFTVSTNTFKDWELDCFVEWTFTVGGSVFKRTEYFDVVKRKVSCNVITADLLNYFPDLDNKVFSGQSNFENQIQLAFRDVQLDIKNRGNRINLIPSDTAIKKLIELKAFRYIFEAFVREPEDRWDDKRARMEEDYYKQFNQTTFRYDIDGDKTIDRTRNFRSVYLKQ